MDHRIRGDAGEQVMARVERTLVVGELTNRQRRRVYRYAHYVEELAAEPE